MLELSAQVIEVLGHAAAGRSLFTAYDKGLFARTPEVQEAYALRNGAIRSAQRQGLLTNGGDLTDAGRAALDKVEAARG